MKISIRRGVFETNSSSTHSIVLAASPATGNAIKGLGPVHDAYMAPYCGDDVENGILGLWFGNYDWDGRPLMDFRSKLSYLLTQLAAGFGWNMEYYPGDDGLIGDRVEIRTQKEWDEAVELFLKKPQVQRLLGFIKEKCPKIKGFRFYWYDPCHSYRLKEEYERYRLRNGEKGEKKIPDLGDPFFEDADNWEDHRIGFGRIDHQSEGLIDADIDYLDRYLFDDNMWVVITNDNG